MITTQETSAFKQEPANYLPLGLIAPSPTNPRKRFRQDKIDELAESIKKHGVIQPVLVRANPAYSEGNGQPTFELVCGERRWRASKQAEQSSILALTRELTDFEALEIQFLENVDRDDLHPLEEAEGLQSLLRAPEGLVGYASPEELAAKMGKSKRWVYLRLALLNLCQTARDAFLDDKINASVANLVARMPNHDQQAAACARILQGFGGEPLSVRATAEYLRQEFMLDLAHAPFDIAAPFQVAGPCGGCNKRSGASPDLFDDVKSGDLCQDSACFQEKKREAHEAKLTHAVAAGHIVLRGGAATKLMPGSATALPAGYVWFDAACPTLTADKRPLAEIFGAKQRGVITLEHPSSAIVRLVKEDDARKLLKSKGLLRPPAPKATLSNEGAATPTPPQSDQTKVAPTAEQKPAPMSQRQLEGLKAERIDRLHGQRIMALLDQRLDEGEPPFSILRLAILKLASDMTYEAYELVFGSMGWEIPGVEARHGSTSLVDAKFEHYIEAEADGVRLAKILALVLVAEELTNHWDLDDLENSDTLHAPTWTIATALDVANQLEAIREQAEIEGTEQVQAEEDQRLGKNAAGDAFAAAHAPATAAAKPGTTKYRDKQTGMTWSGKGLQPKWLKVAISMGKRLEDFHV